MSREPSPLGRWACRCCGGAARSCFTTVYPEIIGNGGIRSGYIFHRVRFIVFISGAELTAITSSRISLTQFRPLLNLTRKCSWCVRTADSQWARRKTAPKAGASGNGASISSTPPTASRNGSRRASSFSSRIKASGNSTFTPPHHPRQPPPYLPSSYGSSHLTSLSPHPLHQKAAYRSLRAR